MITIHQRHRQTDGRTDRQTTCDRNTALCTKVHRAVKTLWRQQKNQCNYTTLRLDGCLMKPFKTCNMEIMSKSVNVCSVLNYRCVKKRFNIFMKVFSVVTFTKLPILWMACVICYLCVGCNYVFHHFVRPTLPLWRAKDEYRKLLRKRKIKVIV